jgi:hypothetical protein
VQFSAFKFRVIAKTITLFLKARALRLTAEVIADKAALDSGSFRVSRGLEVHFNVLRSISLKSN